MKYTLSTVSAVRESFWESNPQFAAERRARKRQNQYRADIRVAFCDHVDSLARAGVISERLADRATL